MRYFKDRVGISDHFILLVSLLLDLVSLQGFCFFERAIQILGWFDSCDKLSHRIQWHRVAIVFSMLMWRSVTLRGVVVMRRVVRRLFSTTLVVCMLPFSFLLYLDYFLLFLILKKGIRIAIVLQIWLSRNHSIRLEKSINNVNTRTCKEIWLFFNLDGIIGDLIHRSGNLMCILLMII